MDTIDRDKSSTKPATQPRDKAKVLHAKPVKGEVDQAALTQEIIRRFPKILDALAK
jgi:hypothetical protein